MRCHAGVGNFGQVLKAKAEGIVPESPHINIVAIKQSKGKQLYGYNNYLIYSHIHRYS